MLDFDLKALREAYARGENITELLRVGSEGTNTLGAIEVAYDLQAGSYIDASLDDIDYFRAYVSELGNMLSKHLTPLDLVLDCGTGEMTTLSGVSQYLPQNIGLMAFDLSVSRIMVGRKFAERAMRSDLAMKLRAFVGSIDKIPLPDKSVDVAFTSHALEPNRGRERQLLKELFRVARRKVVLFEPSYEMNSDEGRDRMDSLGYIRELPSHVAALGAKITELVPMKNYSNPLNATYCHVVELNDKVAHSVKEFGYICPISGEKLTRMNGYYWSEIGGYAYPEIEGVPILVRRNAILMCHR